MLSFSAGMVSVEPRERISTEETDEDSTVLRVGNVDSIGSRCSSSSSSVTFSSVNVYVRNNNSTVSALSSSIWTWSSSSILKQGSGKEKSTESEKNVR